MNYWPACSTNLEECMLPLIDFIRTLVKPGEKTAQSYFGARGWTASISANIFGFTAPLESQDMSWNFNPMAGPWLATHIWEYYDYTRDLKFLKETGYELIKSSANLQLIICGISRTELILRHRPLHPNMALLIRGPHLYTPLCVKSYWMPSRRARNWEWIRKNVRNGNRCSPISFLIRSAVMGN